MCASVIWLKNRHESSEAATRKSELRFNILRGSKAPRNRAHLPVNTRHSDSFRDSDHSFRVEAALRRSYAAQVKRGAQGFALLCGDFRLSSGCSSEQGEALRSALHVRHGRHSGTGLLVAKPR